MPLRWVVAVVVAVPVAVAVLVIIQDDVSNCLQLTNVTKTVWNKSKDGATSKRICRQVDRQTDTDRQKEGLRD